MIIKIILLNLCLLSFAHAKSKAKVQILDQETVVKKITNLIKKSNVPQAHLGIYIATSDSKVVDINSDKLFIPASISKLATTAAILTRFPGGTKFKTQLLAKDEGKSSIKNICLKGGGDPSFVSENMWYLVNAFNRKGIKRIEGDILVDDTLFDHISFDPSREDERVDRAYDAPVSAMSFNWNAVNIFISPTHHMGEEVDVTIDPENDYIQLKNKIQISSGTNIIAERVEDKNFNGDKVIISGKISKNSKEVVIYKNITNPGLWSGYNLKSFLRQRGTEVLGNIKVEKCPADLQVVAESESKPIEIILADMNKFSNNFVAEMLTKNLSAANGEPGSIAGGMKIINENLKKMGIDAQSFHLINPSGLTRENKGSAKMFWSILNYINSKFQYKFEFTNSLPIAGIDGTLKNRYKETAAVRRVRAKTGSMNGVVSLAGFIDLNNGDSLPFAMIYNGGEDESKIRSLFDKIVETTLEAYN